MSQTQDEITKGVSAIIDAVRREAIREDGRLAWARVVVGRFGGKAVWHAERRHAERRQAEQHWWCAGGH